MSPRKPIPRYIAGIEDSFDDMEGGEAFYAGQAARGHIFSASDTTLPDSDDGRDTIHHPSFYRRG